MSRILFPMAKLFRFSRAPGVQLRKSSDGGKCPPNDPPAKSCTRKMPGPGKKATCTTNANELGRTDKELDECLAKQNANPLSACTTAGLAAFPCAKTPMAANRGKKEVINYPSAWEKIECCAAPCAVDPIRHDILYLKPEEKCMRRTWCEWSTVCFENAIKCEPPKFMVDPPEYRPRTPYVKEVIKQKCGTNPCEPEEPRPSGQINKAATANQPSIKIDPCPRMRLPGCRPANKKVKCVPPVAPKCCQKRCTQYPSFSECCRKRPELLPGQECGCLDTPSKCEGFARMKWLAEN